ncbi:MAG TPA: TonB-dependent receptor [Povalibacter sp.]|uniref:TonB-dependent receptor n=1 Tax=Povalibacter sp. TaxID=1962978 RepID=UPI002CEBCE28|nr:TonB-dependent receptor [Povalibacter sp.]HMN45270.1 TonB-dependent receptor [Povalibacter sp.]
MKRQHGLIVTMLTPVIPFTAGAQEGSLIDEIIVTAQKREASLQDVPFSVAAMTESQMRDTGTGNIAELSRNVAGLTITDLGAGQSQVAIRGVSAGQVVRDLVGGVKESVGVYLDESPISQALFTPDLDLFDLERFEVLRGPQGTLFGAGSASGTLRYITRAPQLGKFEGAAEANLYTGTDTDVGGGFKAALNVPMGEVAALRLVGYYDEIAGFIDSYYPGRNVREDVNSGSKTGGRVSLLIQPNDVVSITPRIVYQKLETDGYPRIDVYNILGNPYTTTQPAVDPGERGQVTQLTEGLDDEFLLADLKMEFGLGAATLTSVTSYTDRDVVVTRDASSLSGSVTYGSFAGTPAEVRLNSPLIDTTRLKALSQELRLASSGEGTFEWLVGAFYQDIDRDYGQDLPTPGYDLVLTSRGLPPSSGFNAPPDTPYYSQVDFDFKQMALFGEATVHFNERWALTGGIRYYDFDEDRVLTFAGVFADQGYTDEPGSTSSDGYSPRVILTFEPNDDVLLSAQVSRGFRLGGINDPLNVTLCSDDDLVTYDGHPDFSDEKNTNYEIGAKTRFADGRVQFNAAVFYSDIDDLQVIADAGSCSSRIVLNAQAESIGGEIELLARPNANWDLGLSATYIQAEITESRLTGTGDPIAGIRDGNRLPTSPELQAAASATYHWQFSSQLDGFANLTLQHVGSSWTQLADQEAPFGCVGVTAGCTGPGFFAFGDPTITGFTFDPELPSYEIGNFRIGVRTGQWEVAAFLNNLWDERAYLSVDRERGTRARVGYLTNTPRTYGLSARVTF